jgi:hypothetical protein
MVGTLCLAVATEKAGVELVGGAPVVVAPRVTLGDELAGLEALHELDDLQVRHGLDVRVLGGVEVLLGPQDTLLEEVLVHRHAVLLGDQHGCCGGGGEGKRVGV